MKDMSAYGTFKVSTEGDIEGRTMKNLGTFTGFIDEIAFHLANRCYYKLHFERTKIETTAFTPTGDEVEITFYLSPSFKEMKETLKGRNVTVKGNNHSTSFVLVKKSSEKEKLELEREHALDKLTKREKELLGLL